MSVATQYFKIIKESIEGKDKWVLYHLKNESALWETEVQAAFFVDDMIKTPCSTG